MKKAVPSFHRTLSIEGTANTLRCLLKAKTPQKHHNLIEDMLPLHFSKGYIFLLRVNPHHSMLETLENILNDTCIKRHNPPSQPLMWETPSGCNVQFVTHLYVNTDVGVQVSIWK